jgi:hypothetical protein
MILSVWLHDCWPQPAEPLSGEDIPNSTLPIQGHPVPIVLPADLYHLDHFLGACVTRLGALLNLASYQVLESRQLPSSADPDGRPVVAVDVAVKDARGSDAGACMRKCEVVATACESVMLVSGDWCDAGQWGLV